MSGVNNQDKKELQTMKYISEGGTVIKKNLFNSWLNLYENEIIAFAHQEGIKALPP